MTTRTDQGTVTGTVTTSNKVTMATNNRSTRMTSVQMNPWEATTGTIRREGSNEPILFDDVTSDDATMNLADVI